MRLIIATLIAAAVAVILALGPIAFAVNAKPDFSNNLPKRPYGWSKISLIQVTPQDVHPSIYEYGPECLPNTVWSFGKLAKRRITCDDLGSTTWIHDYPHDYGWYMRPTHQPPRISLPELTERDIAFATKELFPQVMLMPTLIYVSRP